MTKCMICPPSQVAPPCMEDWWEQRKRHDGLIIAGRPCSLDEESLETSFEGVGTDLAQVMSPTGLSTALTRSSLSERVFHLLKRVRFQKLRISSLHPTTSHCCLRLKILLKALLRLKKQTWTMNKFVLCWLHHGICWSEKQVRNDHKVITLKEEVCCQVHLNV